MYNPAQKEMVRLRFSAKNLADLDFFSKSDPFLEVSRPARQGYNFTTVRKTETINNNLNPNWKVLYVSLAELCDRDFDMKLKLDVYDEDNSTVELIGEVCLSLQDLLDMAESQTPAQLFEVHKRDKPRGDLYVKECVVENYSHEPSQQQVDRRNSLMSLPGDRRSSMMSQPGDRRSSMMSQPGDRRSSLMSQSGELVTPHNQIQVNQNYSSQAYPGSSLNNNPAIPPPPNYTVPAASQGYPPGYNPGYAAHNQSHIPSMNPGDSPRYPPAQQQFQPPTFPGSSGQHPANTGGQHPAITGGQHPAITGSQPPAYHIPVPFHDQHNIPAYNAQPGGPPGPTYPLPPSASYPLPPGSTYPANSSSLYPQLP